MNNEGSRIVKDPICGKDVDTLRARAVGIFGGVTYYFCSAECKAQFKDPRQSEGMAPPTWGDRRKPGGNEAAAEKPSKADKAEAKAEAKQAKLEAKAAKLEAKLEAKLAATAGAGGGNGTDDEVRYAHSRIRRITGEVGTPVVQIDLSPNAKKEAPPPEADAELAPPRSSSLAWTLIAIVMLIIAGGVLLFTLKHK